jgi:hypothetical protein
VDFKEETQPDATKVDTSNQHGVDDLESPHNVRRSNRVRTEPERYGFIIDDCFVMTEEPLDYLTATTGSESVKWIEAINAKMQSMFENHVWDEVELDGPRMYFFC